MTLLKTIFLLLVGFEVFVLTLGENQFKWMVDLDNQYDPYCLRNRSRYPRRMTEEWKLCIFEHAGWIVNNQPNMETIMKYLDQFYKPNQWETKKILWGINTCPDSIKDHRNPEKLAGAMYKCIEDAVRGEEFRDKKLDKSTFSQIG